MKMIDVIKPLLVVIIAIALTWAAVDHFKDNEIQVITESQQTKIDSLTSVVENGRRTRDALLDSLDRLDENFRKYIEDTGDQIANYTSIIGNLRITADRLEDSLSNNRQLVSALQLINRDSTSNQVFTDTVITATKTWTDSLFETTGIAEFRMDSLLVDSRLRQLRPIRLDIVTTQSDDLSRVKTFVRSPDFDSLQATSYTELIPQQKRRPWGWAAAGAILIYELLLR